MSDFGPGIHTPVPDDRGSSRQTDAELLCERWNLKPERWSWLWVIYLTLFAALEELHVAPMDSDGVVALALKGTLWALSLPIGWVGLVVFPEYQPLYILNAPLWALMVEILIARGIVVRHDPEEKPPAKDVVAIPEADPTGSSDATAVPTSPRRDPLCPHR